MAGFAGGLLLYVLALNYLRHGPDGVKGWLRAKFLNDPDTALRAPRAPGGGTSSPGGAVAAREGMDDIRPVPAVI